MVLRLRPLTADDRDRLRVALLHAVHVPPGAPAPDPSVVEAPELARYVDGFGLRAGDAGVLASDDGPPVGAAWLRRWTADEHGYGFVDEATPELSVSVVPGHRGRGVGTAMLSHLLRREHVQADAVSLSVSTTNPARRLYERLGFVVHAEHEGDVVMVLRLGGDVGAARAMQTRRDARTR